MGAMVLPHLDPETQAEFVHLYSVAYSPSLHVSGFCQLWAMEFGMAHMSASIELQLGAYQKGIIAHLAGNLPQQGRWSRGRDCKTCGF